MSKSLKTFPSIAELVNESIADTRKMFWRLFKWSLVSFLLLVVTFITSAAAIALGLFLIQTAGKMMGMDETSTAITSYSIVAAVIMAILIIGGIVAIFTSFFIPTIGTYLIVQEHPKKSTWRALIAKSIKKVGPVILASLAVTPLVLSGLLFFIIPGILLSIWVSYATYLVILNDMKPWAAVRRSIAIWQTYGNQIFVRILAVVAVTSIFQNLPQAFFRDSENPGVLIGFGLLFMVVSILVQIWTYVFMVRLFQTADKLTPANTQPKMARVYALSLPGLLIAAGLIFWGVSFLLSDAGQQWAQREFVDEVSEQTDNATPSAEYDFELE